MKNFLFLRILIFAVVPFFAYPQAISTYAILDVEQAKGITFRKTIQTRVPFEPVEVLFGYLPKAIYCFDASRIILFEQEKTGSLEVEILWGKGEIGYITLILDKSNHATILKSNVNISIWNGAGNIFDLYYKVIKIKNKKE